MKRYKTSDIEYYEIQYAADKTIIRKLYILFFLFRTFIQIMICDESPMQPVIQQQIYWHIWLERLMLHYIYNIVMFFGQVHLIKLKISILWCGSCV